MKTFVKNLKPFIAYWACVAVYMLVAFFGDIYDAWWPAVMAAALCILNGVTGYTDGVKPIRWGIALFGVQLGAGAALCFVPGLPGALGVLNLAFGDWFFGLSTNTAITVLLAVLTVAVPIVPFFIGAAVRQKVPQSAGKKVRMPWQSIYGNAKPFLAYWGCLAVYILVPMLAGIPNTVAEPLEKVWAVCFAVALFALNLVTGCTEGIYKIRWGLMLFTLQMGVCACLTVSAENTGHWAVRNVAAIGNAVLGLVFSQPESFGQSVLFTLLAVLLPVVPFYIGAAVRKGVQKRKEADAQYRISTPQAGA